MQVYGGLVPNAASELRELILGFKGLEVRRRRPARSSVPHPQSTDLELVMKERLLAVGFEHHVRLRHPRTGDGFEYYAATLEALAFADFPKLSFPKEDAS